jgi:hypothetical protein
MTLEPGLAGQYRSYTIAHGTYKVPGRGGVPKVR